MIELIVSSVVIALGIVAAPLSRVIIARMETKADVEKEKLKAVVALAAIPERRRPARTVHQISTSTSPTPTPRAVASSRG